MTFWKLSAVVSLTSGLKPHMVQGLLQQERLGHQLLSKVTARFPRSSNPGSVSNCPTKANSEPAVYLPWVKVSSLQPTRCGPCCLTFHLNRKITAVSRSIKRNASLLHLIRLGHLISVALQTLDATMQRDRYIQRGCISSPYRGT